MLNGAQSTLKALKKHSSRIYIAVSFEIQDLRFFIQFKSLITMWYNEIKFAYSGHNLYIFTGRRFAKQRNSKKKKRNKTQKTSNNYRKARIIIIKNIIQSDVNGFHEMFIKNLKLIKS